MDREWSAYCGLTIVHFLAFPECQGGEGPVVETVKQVVEDEFFSGLEITHINDGVARKQVAQLIKQAHMRIDFGAQPIILRSKLNLNSQDPGERFNAIHVLETYVEQAAELGAQRFVILSGPDPGERSRESAMAALIESIEDLCGFARQFGIAIVLETFDRDVDKKALVGPSDEAAAIARVIRSSYPEFGLLFDMAHMVLLNETPAAAIGVLNEYLAHVHVGNCVKVPGRIGYGDRHPRFGFPGGENDVAELADFQRALFEAGYLRNPPLAAALPTVGFEVCPLQGETSATIIANIKWTWREAWSRA